MGITPNDYVRVKLTEYGRQVLRKQHAELQASFLKLGGDGLPKEDADGWSKFQLWTLMQKFGGDWAGAPIPFDDFEIDEKLS